MLDFILGRYRPIEGKTMPQVLIFGAVMLVLRVLLAMPFWASAQTRWVDLPSGFLTNLSSSTTYLFKNLFELHFFWGTMKIPFPEFTAYMTGVGEVILPILVVAGLFTRLGALGLLAMTCVIQLVFPEALINLSDPMNSHLFWMILAALIAYFGPGIFAIDTVLRKVMARGQTDSAADPA